MCLCVLWASINMRLVKNVPVMRSIAELTLSTKFVRVLRQKLPAQFVALGDIPQQTARQRNNGHRTPMGFTFALLALFSRFESPVFCIFSSSRTLRSSRNSICLFKDRCSRSARTASFAFRLADIRKGSGQANA